MSSLFSEIKIRSTVIKNRIVMPPMACSGFSGEDGLVSLKNLERYRDRARGGVGLIIVEATCVNATGRLSANQLGLWSDDQIRGFTRIADGCHEFDAAALVQIHHAGLAADSRVSDNPVAPSDFQGVYGTNPEVKARALSVAEIGVIQEEFVAAAVRAQKAGFDGVELHGAHGYLISQFLSPMVNKREDDYGGSVVNRIRFAAEIVGRIRHAAGPDFIISCRMGCDEPEIESSILIAQELEKAGIDMLHISTGITSLIEPKTVIPPVPVYFHYSWVVYGGTLIKVRVKVPVIVAHGIRDPLEAGYLVQQNLADFVAVGRGLLVDPEWANKGQQNSHVTACIRCKVCCYREKGRNCPQSRSKKFVSRN